MTAYQSEQYRSLAVKAANEAEALQLRISNHVERYRDRFGADTALASQQISSDIAFNDAIGDRNYRIQLSIMYSNLAHLHQER